MSRLADEKQARTRTAVRRETDQASGVFVSFYPTEQEKAAISALEAEKGDFGEDVQGYLDRGLAFTLTRTRSGDALCLSVREAGRSYGEGQVLAVFHSRVSRLWPMMVYLLDTKYPEWPEKPANKVQLGLNW